MLTIGLACALRGADAVEWARLPLAWHVFSGLRTQSSVRASVLAVSLACVQRAADAVERVCLPLARHVFSGLQTQLSACADHWPGLCFAGCGPI